METTKIKIRPFIPFAKDEQKEGREPFALLTYGNVTIELDYTLLNYLRLDVQSGCWSKTQSICNRGIEEILNEMYLAMDGKLPKYHRDTDRFKNLPYSKNPLSNLIPDGHVEYE